MTYARSCQKKYWLALVVAAGTFCAGTGPSAAAYVQTNLVSDIPGLATITDPSLINPWGISRSPTSPFWVSNQGTSNSTLYAVTGNGTNVAKVNVNPPPNAFVGIPTTAPPAGADRSGQQHQHRLVPVDARHAHLILPFHLRQPEWHHFGLGGGPEFDRRGDDPGCRLHRPRHQRGTGPPVRRQQRRQAHRRIQQFVRSGRLPGAFTDPDLPAGFVPFNVQNIGGKVYVTYAPPGRAAEIAATPGLGVVDVFDENGGSLQRLVTGGQLAAPWGVALAPAGFGQFGGDLLVGNFSFVASEINAFDPVTGAFQGTIPIDVGAGNTPGGLWALIFGSGAGNGGDANALYFNDGINGELNGLFAALQVPEPSSMALLGVPLALLGLRRVRWRRHA